MPCTSTTVLAWMRPFRKRSLKTPSWTCNTGFCLRTEAFVGCRAEVARSRYQFPETVPLPDHHRPLVTSPWEHIVWQDIQTDPLEKASPPGATGYRGHLLVPVRLQSETLGGLDFLSLQPDVYTADDVL